MYESVFSFAGSSEKSGRLPRHEFFPSNVRESKGDSPKNWTEFLFHFARSQKLPIRNASKIKPNAPKNKSARLDALRVRVTFPPLSLPGWQKRALSS